MLGSLATTIVLGWLTDARLVRTLHVFHISQFYVIEINHWVQMIVDIAEFSSKELFFVI